MISNGGGGGFYGVDVEGDGDMVMEESLECTMTYLEQWRFWLDINLLVMLWSAGLIATS